MSKDMRALQRRVLAFYGPRVPDTGSRDHVLQACWSLKNLVDAETRHATLSAEGLARTLARVFVECLCAMPSDIDEACEYLVAEIFEPRNAKYGDSYRDFGAIGVVIRLLDHVRVLEHNHADSMSVYHIANYSIMAFELLIEADEDFIP